jgi:hypothetical protein
MIRSLLRGAFCAAALFTAPILYAAEEPASPPAKPKAEANVEEKWQPLFNGKNLDGWKVTDFGGEGEVEIAEKDKTLIINMGQPMSGITWSKKEPPHKIDYEIRLEAKRVAGTDFFVGLTFPVKDSHCSLIAGGWGGGVIGLSSINDFDASENGTTQYQEFKKDQWYKFRVRVEAERIQGWIDDKQVIDQDLKDVKVSTRIEVDDSKPLGLSTYETKAAIRNFEIRPLK